MLTFSATTLQLQLKCIKYVNSCKNESSIIFDGLEAIFCKKSFPEINAIKILVILYCPLSFFAACCGLLILGNSTPISENPKFFVETI